MTPAQRCQATLQRAHASAVGVELMQIVDDPLRLRGIERTVGMTSRPTVAFASGESLEVENIELIGRDRARGERPRGWFEHRDRQRLIQ